MFYVWAVRYLKYGSRDPLTGLPFSLTTEGHPLKPTLLAHRTHGVPLDFGQSTKYPCSVDDFDPARLNARVEAWRTNVFVKSYRVPAVESFMSSIRK